jgi:hypothetical protein
MRSFLKLVHPRRARRLSLTDAIAPPTEQRITSFPLGHKKEGLPTAAEASAEKQPANDVAGARRGYEGEYNDFGHFHIHSILVCHPSKPSRQI